MLVRSCVHVYVHNTSLCVHVGMLVCGCAGMRAGSHTKFSLYQITMQFIGKLTDTSGSPISGTAYVTHDGEDILVVNDQEINLIKARPCECLLWSLAAADSCFLSTRATAE